MNKIKLFDSLILSECYQTKLLIKSLFKNMFWRARKHLNAYTIKY